MGAFLAFWQSRKHNICYRLHLLLVEEGQVFGGQFWSIKTRTNPFWVFLDLLRRGQDKFGRIFWADLRSQAGIPTQPSAREARGKLGQNSKVNIWPIPSWVFVG